MQFNADAGDWVLISFDPVTQRRIYELDLGNGQVVRRTEYEVEPLLEANAEAEKASLNKRWGDGQVVASVPMHMFYRDLVPAIKQEDRKFVKKWLNDLDNKKFRTFKGNI